MAQLNAGSMLPNIQLKLDESKTITLPTELESDYAIVLFYRGHW